jgi:hypothetical protein
MKSKMVVFRSFSSPLDIKDLGAIESVFVRISRQICPDQGLSSQLKFSTLILQLPHTQSAMSLAWHRRYLGLPDTGAITRMELEDGQKMTVLAHTL